MVLDVTCILGIVVGVFFPPYVILEGLFNRSVYVSLLGSVKGLNLAVVLLPSSKLVQLLL